MFQEKSKDELAQMAKDPEALAGYFVEFLKDRDAKLQEAAKKSQADADAIRKEIAEARVEQHKALNDALRDVGLKIIEMKEGERKSDNSIFPASKQISQGLKESQEFLTTLKNNPGALQSNWKRVSVKLNGRLTAKNETMTFANSVSGGNIPVEDRIQGLDTVPSRVVRLLSIMNQRATTANVVSWTYQASKAGTAGQTTEGATKNQISFDIVVASENVVKTTAYVKVSDEMRDDIDFLQDEIDNELNRELLKAVELGAYSGDGTGDNLNGIRTVAPAFVAGSFALSVDQANIVDVLTIAVNQIRIAQEGESEPNYILMHPTDITTLLVTKIAAADNRYNDRLVQVGGTLRLDGIEIIPTTLVTVDEYLIGDFDRALLYTRDGINIDMGLDADDFTKNLMTIRAEWRGCVVVRNNRRSAFVKGVFSTDIAAIETP